jgi:hypothetical protein
MSEHGSPRRWPVALVLLAPLVLFWDATLGRILLAPGDALLLTLPNRQLVAETLRAGEWPLWNPYTFSGFPMLAVSQTSVFHPGTWLLMALPVLWAINIQMLATFSIAGLATYAYCRAIGIAPWAAVLGGFTFTGSGFMLGHLGHVVIVQAVVALPLLFWCLERLRAATAWRHVAIGAVAIALAVFAGHPQMPVMVLVGGAAYGLFFAIVDPGQVGRMRWLLSVGATLALGVLLAAVQLVPMPELAAQTLRARMSFEEFSSYALPLRQLPSLLLPYLYGGDTGRAYHGAWNFFEIAGYAGVIPPMLALAAVPWAVRQPIGQFWLLFGAVGFLLALGAATPLSALAYRVPLWNLFRGAARNLLFVDLALAVLAAWGASVVLPRHPRAVALAALLVAALVTTCAGIATAPQAGVWLRGAAPALRLTDPALALPVLFGALGAAALLALVRWPSASARAAVLALLAADLFLFARRMDHIYLPSQFIGLPPDYIASLAALPVDPAAARVAPVHAGDYRAARLDFAHWHLPSLAGYEPLMLSRYGELAGEMTFYGAMSDSDVVRRPLFLDLLNAAYLIAIWPDPIPMPDGAPRFAAQTLSLELGAGARAQFDLPQPVPATSLDLVTFLSGAQGVADDAVVGRVVATGADGRTVEWPLRAGADTAEWARERADVMGNVRHRGAIRFETMHAGGSSGQRYLTRLPLPAGMAVRAVTITGALSDARLHVARIALADAASATSTPVTHLHTLVNGDARWEPLFHGERSLVLRNRDVLPRAWLVSTTAVLPAPAILAAVRSGALPDGAPFDPRRVALLEDGTPTTAAPLDASASARVTTWRPNDLEVETDSVAPAFLVLSEIFYPGWRASIDGTAAPIARTNYVLRGVAVPAGRHRVRFVFRPPLVLLGAVISALSALALLVTGLRSWRRGARYAEAA